MKKYFLPLLIFLLILPVSAIAGKGVWHSIGLTGGVKPSVDYWPTAEITDQDVNIAYDTSASTLRVYQYDASSTSSESSPNVIIPDDNSSGTGAWILKATVGDASGGGIDTYTTVALIEAANGEDNDLAYCVETETLYRYEATGSAYTDNNQDVLSTGDGGDTRWLGISGQYINGGVEASSFTTRKTSGTAGKMGVYEANSTDTNKVGFRGPDSITSDRWYVFPDSDPVDYQVFVLSTPSSEESTMSHSRLYDAIEFVITSGSEISTGVKGDIEIPEDFEIERCTLLADQSGSIKIDIWKDTYANYPPTDADTITGGNEPEIVSSTKDQDLTLSGWTRSLSAGDILRFNVDSCTTITRVTISLKGYWKP